MNSIILQALGDEPPAYLPEQFGIGECVVVNGKVGEIYRSAIGLHEFCETGWNADPAHPSVWMRMYWVKTPSDTVFVSEAELLSQNPRKPSAAVLAYLSGVDPDLQAIREHLEMTNALWAIQRLARDLGPLVPDQEATTDTLQLIAERALQALGKDAAPVLFKLAV